MNEQFEQALTQIAEEKGLEREEILKMIEGALAAAFRKDYGKKDQNIVVELNPENLSTKVFDVKTVVEGEPEDSVKELTLEEAKKFKKSVKVGDQLRTEVTPKEGTNFGRIAAQTAKQVIVQKLREAEREIIFKEFKAKERTLVAGVIQRLEGETILVDLGRSSGVLFPSEQIRGEEYRVGARVKVLILHVEPTPKGPKITLSRSHPDIVRRLFEIEVPEVSGGVVEIKSVAREAGSRAKVAVWSNQEGVDPIGSCVGQRGSRIDTIRAELGGEKIDVVEWSEDPVKFIAKALSPAKILNVELNEDNKEARVNVLEDQLSLAIGKAGQNVRLAARLTGWKLDIKPENLDGAPKEATPSGSTEASPRVSAPAPASADPQEVLVDDKSRVPEESQKKPE